MKLYQIRPLLQDMGRNKAKQDKFSFMYNGVTFDVIVFRCFAQAIKSVRVFLFPATTGLLCPIDVANTVSI